MAAQEKKLIESNPELTTQIEILRQDIARLTKTVKSEAKATAKAKKTQVLNTANVKAAETKAKYDELTTTAEKSIRENPLKAAAIAVAAGMLIGLISRR